jgi:hypothetical protein
MAQRPAFDMTKLSSADKIIGGGAGIFFVWSILPIWYKGNLSAWNGVTTIGGVASLLALIALWVSMAGTGPAMSGSSGVHLGLGALAFLFTLIGSFDKPDFSAVSWGLWLGLVWALIWAYGGFMKMAERGSAPPPPAEGGFTA